MKLTCLFALLAAAVMAQIAGCGAGSSISTDAVHGTDGFELKVLPDSFALGGSAAVELSLSSAEDGAVVAQVSASDARALKALYFDLDYDSSRFAPVSGAATDGLAGSASADDLLQLAVLDDPGTVHCGQVLVHPEQRDGFSGSAVMAEVRFAPAAAGRAVPVRAASLAPVTPLSAAVLTYDEPSAELRWGYCHQGDYDQNSVTTISDLTPMATRLGKLGPFDPNSADAVVNGDGNAQITIADLTPIGANFSRRVEKYNIYASANASDVPANPGDPSTLTPLGSVDYTAHTGQSTTERLQFSFVLAAPDPALLYWVRPADGTHEGTPSNTISPAGGANNAPVVNSIGANPMLMNSAATSEITVDATDADGDTLSYGYSADIGSITGTGAVVTYTAPAVVSDTVATISVTVGDGKGGQDSDSVQVTISSTPVNTPPVINGITPTPPTIVSGASSTLDADATDADGDTLTYTWTPGQGGITGTGASVTFDAPTVATDTVVTIDLLVDDGNGGTDNSSVDVMVLAAGTEVVDHVELDAGETLGGSGTSGDTYQVTADFEIQLHAISSASNDWTDVVTWTDSSPQPGTAFSGVTLGELYVSPFDGSFNITATKDAVTTPAIYFTVVPPS